MNIDASWTPLISAVVLQAFEDAKSKDVVNALDAVLFLTGDDLPLWCEAAGLPDTKVSIKTIVQADKKIKNKRYNEYRRR